jgi:hypothetical protein
LARPQSAYAFPLTSFGCLGGEQVEDLGGGKRLAVVVALGDVTGVAREHGCGGRGFDAFCHGGEAQIVGQVDDRAHNRCDAGVLGDRRSERAVEFDLVDRQVAEVVQRGVSAAEVVDGNGDAESVQSVQDDAGPVEVAL